jgi:hypothetical protein
MRNGGVSNFATVAAGFSTSAKFPSMTHKPIQWTGAAYNWALEGFGAVWCGAQRNGSERPQGMERTALDWYGTAGHLQTRGPLKRACPFSNQLKIRTRIPRGLDQSRLTHTKPRRCQPLISSVWAA